MLIGSVVLMTQLHACNREEQAKVYEAGEAYELYSAILPKTNHLLVRDETQTHDFCLSALDEQAAAALGVAIKNYHELNDDNSWRLARKFNSAIGYELLPEAEVMSMFPNGVSGQESRAGWQTFSKKHPGTEGWIEFSAVGFNENRTLAVVYMGYHCGEACEGGEFRAMEKTDGKWQLMKGKGKWNHCIWARDGQRV